MGWSRVHYNAVVNRYFVLDCSKKLPNGLTMWSSEIVMKFRFDLSLQTHLPGYISDFDKLKVRSGDPFYCYMYVRY